MEAYKREFIEFLQDAGVLKCGDFTAKSGRDCDKEAEAGLTAVPCGESVTFAQAGKTLLCRKLYHQDMELDRFPENVKTRFFGSEPAHRMYIGEIIEIV